MRDTSSQSSQGHASSDSSIPPPPPMSGFFVRWTQFVVRYHGWFLALMFGITAFFVHAAATKLTINNSVEAFEGHAGANRAALKTFRETFGRDDIFMVMAEGDVFTLPFLEKLRALHGDLAKLDLPNSADQMPSALPSADAPSFDVNQGDTGDDWGEEKGGTIVDETISLINVRRTSFANDTLTVGSLLAPWPTEAELPALRAKVLADRTLVGQVVGADGRHAVIILRLQAMPSGQEHRVNGAIQEIIAKHDGGPGFALHLAGMPVLNAELDALMFKDLRVLLGLAITSIMLILVFLFRHPLGVVIPLSVVMLSMVWTIGCMAVVGYPLTMITNILPAFLVCVGVGDAVHIISVYRDRRGMGVDKREAILESMGVSAVPVVFTSVTTLVGLLSFRTSSLEAISEMGTMGAFGVGVAMVQSFILVPIMLNWHHRGTMGARKAGRRDFIDRFTMFFMRLSGSALHPWSKGISNDPKYPVRKRRAVLLGSLALTIVALIGVSTLRVYHNPLLWIPTKYPVRTAFDIMDRYVGGTASVQLLITPKGPNGMKDLALLQALERLENDIKKYVHPGMDGPLVTNSTSILDVIKETNQAMHGGDPVWYRLPDTDRGVSDLLFMFENAGVDQLKRLVTLDMHRAQMTLRLRWLDATSYAPLAKYIDQSIQKEIGTMAAIQPTGSVYSLITTISALIGDLMRSFGTAFAIITVLMMIVFRSLKLGLISMIPNVVPIAYVMGMMGFMGIPIDMANLLLASIAIGIAVDDTIHFMHHFQEHYLLHGSVERALESAMHQCGRAIVATSVILVAGFSVYLSASMYNIQRFGLLVATTIIFALLSDLAIGPAVLRLFYQDRPAQERQKKKVQHEVAA